VTHQTISELAHIPSHPRRHIICTTAMYIQFLNGRVPAQLQE